MGLAKSNGSIGRSEEERVSFVSKLDSLERIVKNPLNKIQEQLDGSL